LSFVDLTLDDDTEEVNIFKITKRPGFIPQNALFIDLTLEEDDNTIISLAAFVEGINGDANERILSDREAFSDMSDSDEKEDYRKFIASARKLRRICNITARGTPEILNTPITPSTYWPRDSSCEPFASDKRLIRTLMARSWMTSINQTSKFVAS